MRLQELIPLAAGLAVIASSPAEVDYVARLGLFDENEFTSASGGQSSSLYGTSPMTEWVFGYSDRYVESVASGQGAWIANASTGVTYRVGFYDADGGNEFTGSAGQQSSSFSARTENEYAAGTSVRYNGGSSALGSATWVANGETGITYRVGLFDAGGGNEFTSDSGSQLSFIGDLSSAGLVVGRSNRYLGDASPKGSAAWVADANTGATLRIGLYDQNGGNEFTSAAGTQSSSAGTVNESGVILGGSTRYNGGSSANGTAVWFADAAGNTTRIGLFNGAEFTGNTEYQRSTIVTSLTESGFVSGVSARLNGGSAERGQAAWAADAATGLTHRIGFFDSDGGNEFTSSNGTQLTNISGGTESGYVYGDSTRYLGGTATRGQAAWITFAGSGAMTRVGFFDQNGGNKYTSSNGTQTSNVEFMTNLGFAAGNSTIYNGGSGNATWLRNPITGETHRIGLFDQNGGNEFTRDTGQQSTSILASVAHYTESGYVSGISYRYNGTTNTTTVPYFGYAAWIANADGNTIRVGLQDAGGNEFTRSNGDQISLVKILKESGVAAGSTTRYNGGDSSIGEAVWLARYSDAMTIRVGLYDAGGSGRYTDAEGRQSSEVFGLNEAGQATGVSAIYQGSTSLGQVAWIADASSGETTMVGLYGPEFTGSDGQQDSFFEGLTESGWAWGNSRLYTGTMEDQIAWVFDLNSKTQFNFDLSLAPGMAESSIAGMTEGGLAYGVFTSDSDLSVRAFIWTADAGIIFLDDAMSEQIGESGWDSFVEIAGLTDSGNLVGIGNLSSGGSGIFSATVPEPATATLLALAAVGAGRHGRNNQH